MHSDILCNNKQSIAQHYLLIVSLVNRNLHTFHAFAQRTRYTGRSRCEINTQKNNHFYRFFLYLRLQSFIELCHMTGKNEICFQ